MLNIEAAMDGSKPAKKRPQSKVTSSSRKGVTRFIDGGDKRGPVARRFRDLVGEITNDLGGPSAITENQRQIIKRIASLSVWCESQEAHTADGEEVNIDQFQRAANSMRRLCESIGLERKSRPVKTAYEIIAELNAQPDEVASD
jgi:hypothetical protein